MGENNAKCSERPNLYWQLLKVVYGLDDTPQLLSLAIAITILNEKIDDYASRLGPCILVWFKDSEGLFSGIASIHVDDVDDKTLTIMAKFLQLKLIALLEKRFGKLNVQSGKHMHTGISYKHRNERIDDLNLSLIPRGTPAGTSFDAVNWAIMT
eukprot:16348552-Heterocapsa_arctica.AAC.1